MLIDLSAYIASHLLGCRSEGEIVSYFFCRFDDEESLQCETIMGSIIRQLVSHLPAQDFGKFSKKKPSLVSMVDFIKNALSSEYQYYIILDGLDECNEGQVLKVIEAFDETLTLSGLPLKIFLSSRPDAPVWLLKRFSARQRINLEGKENQSDIATDIRDFISATLTNWMEGEEPELQIGDQAVKLKVCDRLLEESDGMYVSSLTAVRLYLCWQVRMGQTSTPGYSRSGFG